MTRAPRPSRVTTATPPTPPVPAPAPLPSAAAAAAPAGARPLAILLVEDNPGDAELLRDLLAEPAAPPLPPAPLTPQPPLPEVVWVERLAAAQALLAERERAGEPVDVVLLDLSLPDARGVDTVARLHAAAPSLPIVILTGLDDEATALQAVQTGAQDYLVKGSVTAVGLRRAVRHAVERQRLFDAAQRATHARDMVLGVVAHDLRNPLSTVKMCATALGESPPAPAESVEYLAGVIQRSAEWMEHIIRDLLDVTAIEAGRLRVDSEPVRVGAVLERARELYQPLATEKGVLFSVAAGAGDPAVEADADRLLQALGNLVGNALKFTPAGGAVALSVAAAPAPRRAVRFEVQDTGPGIPPEHLPRVFDRFWQARETRRAGAGLGLAIVKGIVEAHGGEIAVESTLGAGTRFWFDIPVAG